MNTTSGPVLSDVSETLLLPLYCRAIQSRDGTGLLRDPAAQSIVERINRELASAPKRIFRNLRQGRLPLGLPLMMAMRSRCFDRHVQDFLRRHPDATVVNLGCGLCTRFERVDNGVVRWFDLDLPEVIEWRRRFFNETPRRQMIASDVLDLRWLDAVTAQGSRPTLILAEGLFMYLPRDGVQTLLAALQRAFPGGELVCEVFNARWLPFVGSAWGRFKFRRQLHLGEDARFRSGFFDAADLAAACPGLQVVEEWTYFDDPESARSWFHALGRFRTFRRLQWVTHCTLGTATQ